MPLTEEGGDAGVRSHRRDGPMSSETAWSPRPAPLPLSLGMLMPGDVLLEADAEQGHGRPRTQLFASGVSPTLRPRHLCSRQPLSPEQLPSHRSPSMLPTHPRAPQAGGRQPAGSRGRPGAWPQIHPLPQAPGTWSSLLGGAGPAAFLRTGPDPGSHHAWQLHLLPHWPRKMQATARTGSSPSPPEPPRLLRGWRASCLAPTPDSGSVPGL